MLLALYLVILKVGERGKGLKKLQKPCRSGSKLSLDIQIYACYDDKCPSYLLNYVEPTGLFDILS